MTKQRWHKAINIAMALALVAMLAVALLPQPTYAHPDPDWYDAKWTYRRTITIDHTKVDNVADPSTTYAGFPILVYATGLSNVAADGADIRFTSSDAVTELPREIESYSSGTLYAWVQVNLTKDAGDLTDDEIYMYYGNAAATEPAADDPYGSQNVWDSYYTHVVHLQTDAIDSTSNGYNGTEVGTPDDVTGKILGAQDFIRTSTEYYYFSPFMVGVTDVTIEFWAEVNSAADGNIKALWGEDTKVYINVNATGDLNIISDSFGVLADTGYDYNDNTWHHVVYQLHAQVSGTDNRRVWVDGVKVYTEDVNDASIGWKGNALPQLGAAKGAVTWDGGIDEYRLSSAVGDLGAFRSDGWIKTSYTNQNAPADFRTLGSETRNWESYSDSDHLIVCDSFADSTNHVYMFGEGFASGTTKVGWYDGGNALKQTDTYSSWGGGILNWSECDLMSFAGPPPTAAAGTWHAVVLLQADDIPAAYADAIADPDYVVDDSFEVDASAVPEFPVVMAAIGVAGLCFGIYYWMRKRVCRVC